MEVKKLILCRLAERTQYTANNYKQVHSTTGEVPYYRFKKASDENRSLFREFILKPPLKSIKDISCLRIDRVVNAYRKISINNLKLKVNGNPLDRVNIKIYPLNKNISQLRIWRKDELLDIYRVKNSDLRIAHF